MMSMVPLLFLLAILATARGSLCGKRQYKHEGLCCDMCRPHSYVKQHCTPYNNTICSSCEFGTVMNSYNSKEKCDDCPTFEYYNANFLACMPCQTCGEGEYPIRTCTTRHNTECEVCPEGHFSNMTKNKNSTCLPCTKCQIYLEKCIATKDALCDAVPQTTKSPTHGPTTLTASTRRTKTIHSLRTTKGETNESSTSSTNLTLLIVTAVVLIFLFLAVGFIVYWCTKKNYPQCQGEGLLGGAPRQRRYKQLQTGQLLRSQSASFLMKLVELLTPEGRPNWKELAANFGDFTYEEIANFGVDKTTAAERMLCAWQTKNSSTIDKLYKCCLNIKREDVATYIADCVSQTTDTTLV
ncbi:tumor necrosis factor receptor superfamily member 16-like [Dendronephthya gigantea]|uniref:tumor necrosis factor receptor superfamily member 16-like n=1 Tax=Dendronephthya gigantea TaxID=151771 RepID=UPI00106C4DCD|nr:tumor necrosis factor receptor superfamily member 16-like [Dendronephthya gigantea]XP_028409370.1 tumor necrosis factor receptor superfamily member 16-like [Dendronephthya gigantea]XP_028409371.1 tumor necrosis factor receptor superfamily member 16-like [Dendronephthya gigantea]XP_028409372.1 tumor necrosis factor receptor superfamily member 16-like [Dendronephthya gigantea]